jgi:hypothetical protein
LTSQRHQPESARILAIVALGMAVGAVWFAQRPVVGPSTPNQAVEAKPADLRKTDITRMGVLGTRDGRWSIGEQILGRHRVHFNRASPARSRSRDSEPPFFTHYPAKRREIGKMPETA